LMNAANRWITGGPDFCRMRPNASPEPTRHPGPEPGSEDASILLRSPGDVIEMIPYLLGFRPEQSLVLVGLRQRRVAVTLRLDLADAESADCEHALSILIRADADSVVAVVFAAAPSGHELPWVDLVAGVVDRLEVGLRIECVLLTAGRRWWSYGEYPSGSGHPLPGNASPVPAAATFAGMSSVLDRSELIGVLDHGASEAARAQAVVSVADWRRRWCAAGTRAESERLVRSVKRALFAAARQADQALFAEPLSPNGPAGNRIGQFGVGLRHAAVRDALWLAIDQRRLDGRGLWLELSGVLPAPFDAAPLFLFGWASWRDGNGVLAREAAERALRTDGDYTAAELLVGVVREGLDPFTTPRMR
jgi:hypothetical protein